MQTLINEYKETLKETIKLHEKADEINTLGKDLRPDKAIIGDIISDLEYALEWMETGNRPGNKRGIERRAAYQRERPFDPLLMQRYFRSQEDTYEWDDHMKEDVITSWDKDRIDDALSVLTSREKEIYLMSRGYGLLYKDIARMLGIKISTVKTNIKRAEMKITKQISESLFCIY